MLSYGIPSDAFWTPQDITDSLDRFPLASEQDPRWIADFDSYVQEMVTKLSLQESVKFSHSESLNTDNTAGDQTYFLPTPRLLEVNYPSRKMNQ